MWKRYFEGIRSPFRNSESYVIFSSSLLSKFYYYRQDNPDKKESGGILLGFRRGNHFDVRFATEPQLDDKRSIYYFERISENHLRFGRYFQSVSGHRISYLGEWHTHPQRIPSPSILDLKEWKIISKLVREHILYLIIGIDEIYVGGSIDGQLYVE